jgi:hypothetical protein
MHRRAGDGTSKYQPRRNELESEEVVKRYACLLA